MKGVDFQNNLNDYLMDGDRKITKAHLNTVCKPEHGADTCKYLFLSPIGFVCMKKSPAKKSLDLMAKEKKMTAQSDNCEGLGSDSNNG